MYIYIEKILVTRLQNPLKPLLMRVYGVTALRLQAVTFSNFGYTLQALTLYPDQQLSIKCVGISWTVTLRGRGERLSL